MMDLVNNFWGMIILDGLFFTIYFTLISLIFKRKTKQQDPLPDSANG